MSERKKEREAERARIDRCRRRAVRRSADCRCGQETKRSRSRRRRRKILSQNPFIIFFLEKYFQTPDKHVTEVAREAGKEWCVLPDQERMKYVRLAERERKRRKRLGIKRRRRRTRRDESWSPLLIVPEKNPSVAQKSQNTYCYTWKMENKKISSAWLKKHVKSVHSLKHVWPLNF